MVLQRLGMSIVIPLHTPHLRSLRSLRIITMRSPQRSPMPMTVIMRSMTQTIVKRAYRVAGRAGQRLPVLYGTSTFSLPCLR
jgi:hypothetical protein